jgi:hypothetical protein
MEELGLNVSEETEFESMAETEMIERGIREVEEEYTDEEEEGES